MADAPLRVAVTGAAGYLGSGLVRRLEAERLVAGILALDVRPLRDGGPKVRFVRHDVVEPVAGLLREHAIDTVVHLAFVLRPSRRREDTARVNVGGASRVFEDCGKAGVRNVVYLSSTTVYGAHPDNPPMLTEESPVRPVRGFHYGEDKADAERALAECLRRTPGLAATVLRACPVLGPSADNFVSRAFARPVLVGAIGRDPPMQLLHEEDLWEVMAACVVRPAPGVYNLAGEGVVRWSEMARLYGRRMVKLPGPLLRALTGATWALRLQSESNAAGLDFIRYRWTVSTERAKRVLGATFRHTSRQTWESFASGGGGKAAS